MAARSSLREGDYVSPNLSMVALDSAFPNMIVGDKDSNRWPYLRRQIGHNWYVDQRNPTVGFLSRDEAVLLHNISLLHAGKPCLEIGCWRGWSTAHMALGAGNLEVIDPVLIDPDFRDDVAASLRRAGVLDNVVLHGAASPNAVVDLSEETGKRWSLIFIDGDHEGDAPRLDAEVAHRYAAANATIVLHDLSSPHVAAALFWLRAHGWRTAIYQTMQIMGIAVRGSDQIPPHQPDLSQHWTVPEHLMGMPIVGEPRRAQIDRLLAWLDGSAPPHAPAGPSALDQLPETEAAVLDDLLVRLAARQAVPNGLVESFDSLQVRHLALMDRLSTMEANPFGPDQFDLLQAKHVQMLERVLYLEASEADAQAKVAAAQEALRETRAAAATEAERARTVATERDIVSGLLDLLQAKHVQMLERVLYLEASEADAQAKVAAAQEALQETRTAVATEAERARTAATEREVVSGLLDRLQAKHVQMLERVLYLEASEADAQAKVAAAPPPVLQTQRAAIDEAAYWLARKRILFGLSRRVLVGRTEEVRRLVEDILRRAGLAEATIARAAWLGGPRAVLGLARRRLLAGTQAVQGLIVLDLERAAGPDPSIPDPSIPDPSIPDPSIPDQWVAVIDTVDADRLRDVEERLVETQQRFVALEAAKLQDERELLEADLELAQLRAQLAGRAA